MILAISPNSLKLKRNQMQKAKDSTVQILVGVIKCVRTRTRSGAGEGGVL